MTRGDYTSHLVNNHKPQTSFKETAVFIGDSSHKTRKDENLQPVSTERSLVLLAPNLCTKEEIFNPSVISGLRTLLHYDVAMGKRISVRLLCRALIQKYEDDDVITKPFFCQTSQVCKLYVRMKLCRNYCQITVGNDTDIESFLKFASAKISKDLSLLYSTPSGDSAEI